MHLHPLSVYGGRKCYYLALSSGHERVFLMLAIFDARLRVLNECLLWWPSMATSTNAGRRGCGRYHGTVG